ncbi:MAG TPA: hypothetical protein VHZ24_07525 [Pirellulales bacterium]|jgi:hypothetical protein|nr:hypothetical protein [Pirellulales bacterium]
MPFSAKIDGNALVIRVPMNEKIEQSATEKSLVVASTRGNKVTECVVPGKEMIVDLNAYIPMK